MAVHTENRCRWINIAARDRRHIRKTEEAVIHAQIDGSEIGFRIELPAYTNADPLRSGLHNTRRRNRILILKRLENCLLVEAKGCHLPRREFEIDRLILRADQLNLTGIGNSQNFGANIFGVIAQLAHR